MRTSTKVTRCIDCNKRIANSINRKKPRCMDCWHAFQRKYPEINPGYRDGKMHTAAGYIAVLAPRDHPYAWKDKHRVMEHRLVMEKHLGRYLKRSEEVHHLDKNKSNNDLSNLVLTSSRKEHMHTYHRIATHCKMCGKPGQMRRGYCLKHYTRWFESGFKGSAPAPDKPTPLCKTCGGKHVALGYCESHYRKLKKGTLNNIQVAGINSEGLQ